MADVVIEKPWGQEVLHSMEYGINVKTILVENTKRTSKHYHRERTEVLTCVKGRGTIHTYERMNPDAGEIKVLLPGDWILIPVNTLHRIFATQSCDFELLETSVGSLTDVIRMEDDYGRITCQCEAYDGDDSDLCEPCNSERAHSTRCTNCKQ